MVVQASAKRRVSIPTDPATVVEVSIDWPRPSPENESVLYKPVCADDPEIIKLSASMAEHGQKEPLVLTRDGYIVSGHRRRCAARLAGFRTVAARFEQYRRVDDIDHHMLMLREYNRQRDKSDSEKVREEIVSADPEEAYRAITEHRLQNAMIDAESLSHNPCEPRWIEPGRWQGGPTRRSTSSRRSDAAIGPARSNPKGRPGFRRILRRSSSTRCLDSSSLLVFGESRGVAARKGYGTDSETIEMGGRKARSEFSAGTMIFVEKIKSVLEANRRFLPFSLRRLHYLLVSEETFRYQTAKRQTPYGNDRQSYKTLSDVATRMRLAGIIPFEWIDDETRPEHYCRVHNDPRAFLREELSNFGKGFYRDLMQSQSLHFHIHCEKNTLLPIIKDIAGEYTIRVTSGRGFSSIPPRRRIQKQFQASGKDGLVLLMMSDFDPEGECIVETFARSLRDDFGIQNITPVKVGLTADQRDEHDLPPLMVAKRSSSRYAGFVEKHGEAVWEIEALPTEVLRAALTDAIDSLIDVDAFNREVDREKENAAFLGDFRREWMHQAREGGIDFGDDNE